MVKQIGQDNLVQLWEYPIRQGGCLTFAKYQVYSNFHYRLNGNRQQLVPMQFG